MAFSKSKFLTLFLLFSSLHLCLANEEPAVDPVAQSEILGQKPPYAQDCCNYGHTTCCGGGDYSNPPCVQNPSNKWCSGPSCQPSPTCSWQGQAGNYCNPPCVQNPSNKCCSGPSCQPSPTCSWQGKAGDYCNPPCVQNPSNKCCSGPSCQPSPTCSWQGQAGDYCNPPCVQNPSNKCYSGPSCLPSPTCPWQGPCSSCGCVGSNVKVEGQLESDHPSSEPMPPKN